MRLYFCLIIYALVVVMAMPIATAQEASEAQSTQAQNSSATNDTASTNAENSSQDKIADPEQSKNEDNANTQENKEGGGNTANLPPTPLNSGVINAPIDTLLQHQSDLKHYLPNKNIKAMQLGMQEHLVLIEENKTSQSKGVMILLPNWHKNAAGSNAINHLRNSLPEQGWTTLTIQPPSKPDGYPSKALDNKQRQEENQKILTEYQEQLAQIISQVTQQASEYPGVIIAVAEGGHGAVLTSVYQRQLSPSPTALVLLSSALDTLTQNQMTAEHLTELSFPILDLALFRDNDKVRHAIKLRDEAVKQQLKSFYRQRIIQNQIPSQYPPTSLLKNIKGWLASLGW
ncbi:DUF3530 family protein [Thalassotalea ganghwensis]